MKPRLFLKMLVGYLLFAILGFLLVFVYASPAIQRLMLTQEAYRLYDTSYSLATSYATDYYNSDISLTDLHNEIRVLSSYVDATIYLVNTSGCVISSSDSEEINSSLSIDSFDPTDFTSNFYLVSTFYGSFDESMLNVISPITINYKVRGYITIHKSVEEITTSAYDYVNIVYLSYFLVLSAGLLISILSLLYFYLPIRRIARIAARYGSGNFDQSIQMTSFDELGVIAASLDSMAYELDNLEEDQRKFVSNISHDFRSPLTSIRGYANAILDGTIPVEMQDKYLDIIVFETERLTKLTDNLLELNRIGPKGMILDINSFDLNEVIKRTATTFEGICRERAISIDLIMTGQTMYVKADINKIQQVLYNLLDNAIKFSHNQSTITIETTERNDKIYVNIKDTGIGIPKESLNKIWDRFYKTDQSRGKDKKGTGLGLAIVKEIIQAHNETIHVISTENVGTEFTFTLTKA